MTSPDVQRPIGERPPIDVSDRLFTVPVPGHEPLTLRLSVVHRAESRWMFFGDIECCGRLGIRHRFRVVLEHDDVWDRLPESLEDQPLREVFAAYRIPGAGRIVTDEAVILAELHLEQAPTAVLDAGWTSWHSWLDTIDSELAEIGGAVDEIVRRSRKRHDGVLIGGSLLLPRRLGVHPLVRGQEIGAGLLAHALWVLSGGLGDLAVLMALPSQTRFEPREPPRNAAGIRALVRYYARMGFERTPPRKRIRDNEPVLMHRWIGGQGIGVAGFGDFSVVRRGAGASGVYPNA